jgi:hypothetical protein
METIDLVKVIPLIERFNQLTQSLHSHSPVMFSLKKHCFILDEIAQIRCELEALGVIRHL